MFDHTHNSLAAAYRSQSILEAGSLTYRTRFDSKIVWMCKVVLEQLCPL